MSNYNLWQNVEKYTTSEDIEYDGVEVYSTDGKLIGSAPENTELDNPMLVRFPWNNPINGTNEGQIVANTIWMRIKGFAYTPFNAQNALTHPAIELGEAVILDSHHRIIASQDISMDLMYTANIAAPQKTESDPEYDFEGGMYTDSDIKSSLKRVSRASASLRVNVDSIESRIQDDEGVLAATLTFDAHGLVVQTGDPTTATTISGSQITTQDLNLTGRIAWADLTSQCQSRVDQGKGDDNPSYIKSTYIDNAKVVAGTIIGGAIYSTGLGSSLGDTAAYYISDGITGSAGSTAPNSPLGVLCYDGNGDTSVGDAAHRVILKTFQNNGSPVALKLQAGNSVQGWSDMSLEANYLYVACPLVLDRWSFGTSLPTASDAPRYGQLFFLVQSTS